MNAARRVVTPLSISIAALAALAAVPPAAAAALKTPVIGVDAEPVSAPGSDVSYVTRRAGRNTKLVATAPGGPAAVRSLQLTGRLAVPVVAYDGSADGLSEDGRTLVLIDPRNSLRRRSTRLAVVDPRRMRLRRVLRLRGNFSFDAISPDGRTMYLIQYLLPADLTSYAVRAYDMRAHRLLPDRIVDPSEPDEDMSGLPMTRARGMGGRWAYTLYDGNEHPFIHALDTVRRSAVCIDMDMLAGRRNGLGDLKLVPSGGRLEVVDGAEVLASVDTTSHEVIQRPARRARATDPRGAADGGFPWLLIAGPTSALLLVAAVGGSRLTHDARVRSKG
jgi:hypothetical protein